MELLIKLLLLFLTALKTTQGSDSCNEVKHGHGYPYLHEASSFSQAEEEGFDYIIVGGGTSGCPLAATLSRNYSVLVLERGGSPYGNPNISHMQNFHIGLSDTSPSAPSQPFISTDGVINTRARVLGGGTCINAGFYTRASQRYVKTVGWDAKLVNESYPWVEQRIVHWPEVAPWQAALRDGLLEAGVAPFNGYTYNHLYGTKIGGIIFDKDGFRHTAADLLAAGNNDNLKVLLHATVERIIFERRGRRRRPTAVGVEFKDNSGKRHRALLNGGRQSEVILSAGAIGSPQLLQLSGVGPRKELKKLGIPVVIDNLHVGKGMADNPLNSIFMPTKKPVRQSLIQTVGITHPGVFIEASSGFSQSPNSIKCHHGIMSAEIGQLSTIPPGQRSLEAVQKYKREIKKNLPKEAFQGGFILEKISGPLSHGGLRLVNGDVHTPPVVTFNYFSHPEDLQRCVYGVRSIERVVQTKRFADLTVNDAYTMEALLNMSVQANVNLIPKHTNDTASVEQFCRDTVTTIWHYHGGCHIGKVVDGEYRVIGAARLRVVDGSTFNKSPGTNPQATVMMMGRYMGVKILRKRLGRAAGV
ncbi:protein HOTHEAD-like [Zingiber officinale]|uniref:protein HOTHEAD-like n=1 Tax=Zingiber officinale TaxID=94328 RepID=UPI001C4B4590|nr:protein HOTHEAD-like [Zingiber officinale]